MPYYASQPFGRRMRSIERKHRRLEKGAVTVTRSDGLMILRPRRSALFRFVRAGILLAAGIVAFKSFVFLADGEISYETRVAQLAQGTLPETYAARIMEIDPVTQFVIDQANWLMAERL